MTALAEAPIGTCFPDACLSQKKIENFDLPSELAYLEGDTAVVKVIEKLFRLGSEVKLKIEQGKNGHARDEFEKCVDRIIEGQYGPIFLEKHPVYDGNLFYVIRCMIGQEVGGKDLQLRRIGRGISDRSGKRK